MQVKGLQMLQEELLALRENLQPLQKKQREERMKAEPNETYLTDWRQPYGRWNGTSSSC